MQALPPDIPVPNANPRSGSTGAARGDGTGVGGHSRGDSNGAGHTRGDSTGHARGDSFGHSRGDSIGASGGKNSPFRQQLPRVKNRNGSTDHVGLRTFDSHLFESTVVDRLRAGGETPQHEHEHEEREQHDSRREQDGQRGYGQSELTPSSDSSAEADELTIVINTFRLSATATSSST